MIIGKTEYCGFSYEFCTYTSRNRIGIVVHLTGHYNVFNYAIFQLNKNIINWEMIIHRTTRNFIIPSEVKEIAQRHCNMLVFL